MRLPWRSRLPSREEAERRLRVAEEEKRKAEELLARMKLRAPDVEETSRSLREHREENHFAEKIARVYRDAP